MAEGKVNLDDVFKRLWVCRDFELSALWQRSVMLGVFLVASYAGYGSLLKCLIDKGKDCWNGLNLLAIGVCWFGLALSVLWIMMLKGSKAWYEIYESAINDYAKQGDAAFSRKSFDVAGFNFVWRERRGDCDEASNSLLSVKAGCYSVSRTAIMVGQVSMIGWLLLSFSHLFLIVIGRNSLLVLVSDRPTMTMVAIMLFGASILSTWKMARVAHSSTLEDYFQNG